MEHQLPPSTHSLALPGLGLGVGGGDSGAGGGGGDGGGGSDAVAVEAAGLAQSSLPSERGRGSSSHCVSLQGPAWTAWLRGSGVNTSQTSDHRRWGCTAPASSAPMHNRPGGRWRFAPTNPSPPSPRLVPSMADPGASRRRGRASSAGRWWQSSFAKRRCGTPAPRRVELRQRAATAPRPSRFPAETHVSPSARKIQNQPRPENSS